MSRLTHDLTGRGRFTLRWPAVLAAPVLGATGIDMGGGSWSAMGDSGCSTNYLQGVGVGISVGDISSGSCCMSMMRTRIQVHVRCGMYYACDVHG